MPCSEQIFTYLHILSILKAQAVKYHMITLVIRQSNPYEFSTICEMRLFADDSHLYDISKDVDTSVAKINNDLISLNVWATQLRVTFNPNKTVYMVFSRSGITPEHSHIVFSETTLQQVNEHKH